MHVWLEIALEIFRIGAPILLVWYASNRPKSWLGRLARKILATASPKPESGEIEFKFFLRYSFWSAKWAIQLLLVEFVGGFVMFFQWRETTAYQTVFQFMLPMLIMLAIVGSFLLFVRGIYCDLKGSGRIFKLSENTFVSTGNIQR